MLNGELLMAKFYFGPYESNGIVRHKPKRLFGAIKHLSSVGYEIELIPTSNFEVLLVKIKNLVVFRCNIKNLQYNIEIDDDVVCQKLVIAVMDASIRLRSQSNVPTYSYFPHYSKKEIDLIPKLLSFDEDLDSEVRLLHEINKTEHVSAKRPKRRKLPPKRDYNLYIDNLFDQLGYEMDTEYTPTRKPSLDATTVKVVEEEEGIKTWGLYELFKKTCNSYNTPVNILPKFQKTMSQLPRYKLIKAGLISPSSSPLYVDSSVRQLPDDLQFASSTASTSKVSAIETLREDTLEIKDLFFHKGSFSENTIMSEETMSIA